MEPSEAEVEAAAEALIKSAGALHWSERADDSEWYRDRYFATARAALTAAAQVRERGKPSEEIIREQRDAWPDRQSVQAPSEPAEASRDHPGETPADILGRTPRPLMHTGWVPPDIVTLLLARADDSDNQELDREAAETIVRLRKMLDNIERHPDTPELIRQYAGGAFDFCPSDLGERKE
jgi:hypothetical protein